MIGVVLPISIVVLLGAPFIGAQPAVRLHPPFTGAAGFVMVYGNTTGRCSHANSSVLRAPSANGTTGVVRSLTHACATAPALVNGTGGTRAAFIETSVGFRGPAFNVTTSARYRIEFRWNITWNATGSTTGTGAFTAQIALFGNILNGTSGRFIRAIQTTAVVGWSPTGTCAPACSSAGSRALVLNFTVRLSAGQTYRFYTDMYTRISVTASSSCNLVNCVSGTASVTLNVATGANAGRLTTVLVV